MKYVATVGFFDGVHAGHRFLIEELKTLAKARNMQSLVITFNIHPRKVLNSDYQPQLLNTLPEKLELLQTTGVDTVEVLDFNRKLASLTAYDFIETVLKERYNVSTLLVGHDHRFGHNRSDGFPEYKVYGQMLGMEVIQAGRFKTAEDRHVSSSDIRQSIGQGDMAHANKLLTYPYSFEGKVIDGFRVGRKIGFPTANLLPLDTDKLIPPFGVYAVRVVHNGTFYKGMMNIGTRPTLNNSYHTSLESVGVRDVLAKSKGSSNPHSVVKATIDALLKMKDPYTVAQLRGISMGKVFNG